MHSGQTVCALKEKVSDRLHPDSERTGSGQKVGREPALL